VNGSAPAAAALTGEVALVTGGTRGIGRAIALDLARCGARVAVTYRSSDEDAAALGTVAKAEGLTLITTRADVAAADAMREAVESVTSSLGGPVDLLINNAGVVRDAALYALGPGDWEEVVRTNLSGAYHASQSVVYGMMRRRRGRIVNLSSAAAIRGVPGQAAYAATKAGLLGFTRSLARELARFAITVNAVAPGYIETEMTAALPAKRQEEIGREIPLGRLGSPEEVAALVRFLCTTEAAYITGQVYAIDGGLTA
jgi:3-oxoacyl-[acyl-carrier protein] reductase